MRTKKDSENSAIKGFIKFKRRVEGEYFMEKIQK